IGEGLEVGTSRGVGFLRGGIGSQHAGLNAAVWSGVKKTAKGTRVVSGKSIFILAVNGVSASEFQRVTAHQPAQVAREIVLVGEVVIITEGGESTKTISGNRGNEV